MKVRCVATIALGLWLGACAKPGGARLEIALDGDGSTTPAAGPHDYASGATVTVTAIPAPGATFTGWAGAATGTANPVSFVVEGEQTLVARFSATHGDASSGGSSSGGGASSSGASSSGASTSGGSSSGASTSGGSSSGGGAISTVSVNAGGDAVGTFLADAHYSGGSTYSTTSAIDTSLLTGDVPDASVLQTERYGEFTYTIPDRAPGSAQTVTLYFEESIWTAAGQRTFDVAINGAAVLSAFDIFSEAGGANKAVAKTFSTTADDGGQVVIQFKGTGTDNPKVCALSVTGQASSSGGSSGGSGGSSSGASSSGGSSSGSSSGGTTATGPCDLYAAGNTPCVAAHSTVRALYGSYGARLYQVRRGSDKATRDIGPVTPGGFADAAAQDAFCSGTTCTISVIYDQSPQGNDLTSAPAGGYGKTPDREADATALRVNVGGHPAYAVYVDPGVGYRNDRTKGVATGDEPEGMYMVASGKHVNGSCCFDYGNAETTNNDDGNGTMEAIYLGTCTIWGRGSGSGPWVMADLENGLFAGGNGVLDGNTPVPYDYVTAMVKGKPGRYAIKGADAQSGPLATMYDGARPTTPGYDPMKKQGAIILGIGGDNSNLAVGTFFEGCMTSGYPSDATEDAVQADIVAAGYGR